MSPPTYTAKQYIALTDLFHHHHPEYSFPIVVKQTKTKTTTTKNKKTKQKNTKPFAFQTIFCHGNLKWIILK
jgi:hypothetical protein